MSIDIPLFRITDTMILTGHLGDESTGNWWITHRKRQWWRVFLCMELIGSLEWEPFPVDAHLMGCFGNLMGPEVLIRIITQCGGSNPLMFISSAHFYILFSFFVVWWHHVASVISIINSIDIWLPTDTRPSSVPILIDYQLNIQK